MGAMATGVEMMEKEQGEQLLEDPCSKSAEFGSIGHGCEMTFEGKFTLPPPARGRDQLQALLHRQWLHKRRGWQQTSMEILSPLLLMTLLIWGWSRSVEEYHVAQIYVNRTVPISFMLKENLVSNSKSLLQLCPPSVLAQQQLSPRELGRLVELMRQEVIQGLGEVAFQNLTSYSNDLPPFSPALAALSLKCIESAMQVTTIIKSFDAYNGPLPVPSFDAFVQTHKLLQRTLKAGKGKQYEDALRAQRMFGNLLGNLLQLTRLTRGHSSRGIFDQLYRVF